MKKIIIIALAVSTLGFASCTKDNSVKPAKATKTVVADKTDVGQGDGDGGTDDGSGSTLTPAPGH